MSSLQKLGIVFGAVLLLMLGYYFYSSYAGTTIGLTLTTNPDLNRGLVGHWTFDGEDFTDKVYDTSGNGNHGYVYNTATASIKAMGVIGQGVEFDYDTSNNEHINAGSAASLDNITQKTIVFWMNASEYPVTEHRVISKGTTWGVRHSSDNAIYISHSFSTQFGAWRTANDSVQIGEWIMVAVTYDRSSTGNDPQIYINGQSLGITEQSTPSGSASSDGTNNLTIGDEAGQYLPFDGVLDDVRIYNRILSGEEVKRLYELGR